jgi:hypothetical protein
MRILAAPSLLSLAACATTPATPSVQRWQNVVTAEDRVKLRDWRKAFTRALEQARAANHGSEIASEGVLLEPDAALGGPIPDGNYKCRVIKLGAKRAGMLEYVAYPAFHCRIDHGKAQRFTKLSGSQRHVGLIYPADQLHQVFLGTLVLGDETTAYQYGSDPDRDVAGWVERIGDNRWRMVLPYPTYESVLDVIDLTPEL